MRITIIASDKYVDAVPWSLKALHKFWPDCPYRIDVAYNDVIPKIEYPVLEYYLGPDRGWLQNLDYYLSDIRFKEKESSILLMLEDYITVNVNRELMAIAAEQLKRKDVGMVRLVPTPGPTLLCDYHEEVGEIDKSAQYSMSLQATMWKTRVLKELLERLMKMGCTSAWDFEIKGSAVLSDWNIKELFLGLHRGAIGYKNLYRHGKIQEEAEEWMKANLK